MAYRFDIFGILQPMNNEELVAADATGEKVIVLSRGKDEQGQPYWAYVELLPSRYKAFLQASARKLPMLLQEYGTILRYGADAEVPASVRNEMKERGCDEHYMENMAKDIQKAKKEFLEGQEKQRLVDIVSKMKQASSE